MRQPALAVAEVPSVVGKLPTITQPLRSTTRAVVRPTPPVQLGASDAMTVANTLRVPLGATSTIVEPVPWRLELALKLLMSTSLLTRCPIVRGTTAMPYGLMSPLPGTVDPITVCVGSEVRNGGAFAATTEGINAAAARATAAAVAPIARPCRLGMVRMCASSYRVRGDRPSVDRLGPPLTSAGR